MEGEPVKRMEIDVSLDIADPGNLGDDESPTEGPRQLAGSESGDSPAEGEANHRGRNPDSDTSQNGKKKHRRGKHKGGKRHRHWKPYSKLTWDEKKALDERETKRACQKRQDKFDSGHPMAPYNTTQFLMDQHNEPEKTEVKNDENGPAQSEEVNMADGAPRPRSGTNTAVTFIAQGNAVGSKGGDGSASVDSSEDPYESNDEEEIFMEKEFTEAYENCHAERLQSMSKDELVREYLELETKVERMEKRLKELSGSPVSVGDDAKNSDENSSSTNTPRLPSEDSIDIRNVTSLEEQIQKLRDENKQLKSENTTLKLTSKAEIS